MNKTTIQKTIEESILSTKGDYRFELSILDLLKKSNLEFNWQHGGFYEDDSTGKIREFDMRVEFLDDDSNTGSKTAFLLPIEFKNLSKSKWLIHQIQRPDFLSRHEFFSASMNTTRIVENSILHPVDEWVGKSVNTLGEDFFKNGKSSISDTSHELFLQSINQSRNLLARATYYEQYGTSTIITPLVVVPEGSLIVINYKNSDNYDVVENVERASIHLQRSMFAETVRGECHLNFLHVDVVTPTGLINFINFVRSNISKICDETNSRGPCELDVKPHLRQNHFPDN